MPTLSLAAYANHSSTAILLEACDRFDLPEDLTANIERCGYNVPTPVQKCLGCWLGFVVRVGWGWGWLGLVGVGRNGVGERKHMVSFGEGK